LNPLRFGAYISVPPFGRHHLGAVYVWALQLRRQVSKMEYINLPYEVKKNENFGNYYFFS